MLQIIDPVALGIKPYIMPSTAPAGETPVAGCTSCGTNASSGAEAYRPNPQRSGNLQVDPEIHLPAVMDVDIAYFYNASSLSNGPFGFGRTISPNLSAIASGSPAIVSLTRGDGAIVSFQDNGSGTYISSTPGNLNTLTKDVANNLWKETTLDGYITAYPINPAGQICSVSYVQDSVGNRLTHTYSAGLLQTIQEPTGRVVSLGYSGGLLQYIQDWAGRRTSFLYDTVSASPLNLLTTVTGASGCQSLYIHTTVTVDSGQFGKSSEWLMTGIVDPNGYGTSYTFDRQKRVTTRTVQANSAKTSYLYQPGYMTIVDALGGVTTQATSGSNYALGALQNPDGTTVSITRNAQSQETSRQNNLGAITTTLYDGAGNTVGSTTSRLPLLSQP